MTMPLQLQQPLRGKRFLVTRPENQATELVAGIRTLGGEVAHIPLLTIEPLADLSALAQMASRLADYQACIFISANAVHGAWPVLAQKGWPQTLPAAAVGPGTARALHALGISQVIMPASRFDSEGLLAENFFAESICRGRAFALIRGEGGRDFLAEALRARGARVDEAAVYRRRLHPDALNRLACWMRAGMDDTIVISSSESLRYVMAEADPQLLAQLKQHRLLVPHARIAESARALGFKEIMISAGGDDGLLDFLRSYNGTDKTTNDETGAT